VVARTLTSDPASLERGLAHGLTYEYIGFAPNIGTFPEWRKSGSLR
jgi:hypothetical protein